MSFSHPKEKQIENTFLKTFERLFLSFGRIFCLLFVCLGFFCLFVLKEAYQKEPNASNKILGLERFSKIKLEI